MMGKRSWPCGSGLFFWFGPFLGCFWVWFLVLVCLVVLFLGVFCLFGWVRLCPFSPSSSSVSSLSMMTWAPCPHGVRTRGKNHSGPADSIRRGTCVGG